MIGSDGDGEDGGGGKRKGRRARAGGLSSTDAVVEYYSPVDRTGHLSQRIVALDSQLLKACFCFVLCHVLDSELGLASASWRLTRSSFRACPICYVATLCAV